MDGDLLFDGLHRLCDFGDFSVEWAAPADDHTVPLSLDRGGSPSALEHLVLGQESVPLDIRGGDGGLGAVVAIFLAGAALGIQEHLQSDLPTEVPLPHLERRIQQFEDVFIGRPENSVTLRACQLLIAKGFVCECQENSHGAPSL